MNLISHVKGIFWLYLATLIFVALGAVGPSEGLTPDYIIFAPLIITGGVSVFLSCTWLLLKNVVSFVNPATDDEKVFWRSLGALSMGAVGYYGFYTIVVLVMGMSVHTENVIPFVIGLVYGVIGIATLRSPALRI